MLKSDSQKIGKSFNCIFNRQRQPELLLHNEDGRKSYGEIPHGFPTKCKKINGLIFGMEIAIALPFMLIKQTLQLSYTMK